MRAEYVIPPITEYVFKRGITLLYFVAVIPITYFSWPWGLLVTGPTLGGSAVWALSSKRKIECSTQTSETDSSVPISVENDIQPGDPNLVRIMTVPSAPSPVLFSFENKPGAPSLDNPKSSTTISINP